MKLERKHALVLLAVAVWNVLTYAQFTRALINTEEDRPTGYFVAHGVLIVVNMVIAVVLGRWGLRALRAERVTPEKVAKKSLQRSLCILV